MEGSNIPKPSEWKADDVIDFSGNILGVMFMKKRMVVRACFLQMRDQINAWLKSKFDLPTPGGVFVVTGTPGTGKSVFLAFMAAYLVESGGDIVIQRGNEWWSCVSGKTTAHRKEEPLDLLKQPKVVHLADPVGGQTPVTIAPRSQGCTLVFISLRQRSYHAAYSQAGEHADRRHLPVWTKLELVKHRQVLFPLPEFVAWDSEVAVCSAYSLLGGSVRWLRTLHEEQHQGGPTTLEHAAKVLVDRCLESVNSWADVNTLWQHIDGRQAADTHESKASYLLQVHAEAGALVPFKVPIVRLIDSTVAIAAIKAKLINISREERDQFLRQHLRTKELGPLIGHMFQDHVLERLAGKSKGKGKGGKHMLKCRSLSCSKKVDMTVTVPRNKCEVRTSDEPELQFALSQLYCPLAENFPAADFFFIAKTGKPKTCTLWLLQVTKNEEKHDCKIAAMKDVMEKCFEELSSISAINWVLVVPKQIAPNYKNPQKVDDSKGWRLTGSKKSVPVQQYVSEWEIEA